MADQVNNSGGTPKHSRFRKSTVPLAKDHLRRGNTESALFGVNVISRANEMAGSGNVGSGKVEPVLPMFVQMNVRWDSVDQSWREASRYLHVEYRMVLTFIYKRETVLVPSTCIDQYVLQMGSFRRRHRRKWKTLEQTPCPCITISIIH